jgi:predicted transcriptional regulator
MHKTALICLLAALLALSTEAQPALQIQFRTPAQAGGQLSTSNSTWALLVFGSEGPAAFNLEFPNSSQDLNITVLAVLEPKGIVFGNSTGTPESTQSITPQAPFTGHASFTGIGSLYLHGRSVRIGAGDARANIVTRPADECLDHQATLPERNQRDARYHDLCPAGEGVVAAIQPEAPLQFSVEAVGLDTVEWHHAQIGCDQPSCPDGGQRTESTVGSSRFTVTNRILGFHQLTSSNAGITGSGSARRILVGGPSFDLGVHGWVRLPLASGLSCAGCVTPKNQTLFAKGDLLLGGLRPSGNQQLAASMGGDLLAARLDEVAVNPSALFAIGVAGAVGAASILTVLVGWRLLALYARVHPSNLSEKRRGILEAVQAHPGAELSELSKMTGMARGTLRHHIARLLQGGHVVERPQGHIRRFFENHGRYGEEWRAIALLRDPNVRQVHDWILLNPGASAAKLWHHAAQEWGWSKSTTYYRLDRLAKVGLVQREAGREGALQALNLPHKPALTLSSPV